MERLGKDRLLIAPLFQSIEILELFKKVLKNAPATFLQLT